MTTLLDHLDTRSDPAATGTTTTPAQRLRATMAAGRVSFTWFGAQKTLTPEQKARAAEAFDAEGQFLSAGKKLLDTEPPGLPRRHGGPRQDRRLLEGAEPAVPRAGRPADQAGRGRGVRRPDGRLPGRAGRRRRQPRPPLRRAEAGRPRAARLALQPGGLSRDAGRPLRRRRGTSPRRAARLPRAALAGALRGGAGAGRGPVRGGRPAGRAGVPRRVRPARRPPDRADHGRRRGRPAPGLPRLGRRQPRASSSSGSARSTSARTTSSTSWSPRRSGRSGASAPRTSATASGLRQRGGGPALAGPDVARRDAGRAAPAADPPAGGRAGRGRDGARRRPRRPGPRDLRRGDRPRRRSAAPRIARASLVEPDGDGRWHADLRPCRGPVLGPFARRSEALAAEGAWLEAHWLCPAPTARFTFVIVPPSRTRASPRPAGRACRAGRGARPIEEPDHDPGPARPRRRRRTGESPRTDPPPRLRPPARSEPTRGPRTSAWSSTARSAAGPSPTRGRPRRLAGPGRVPRPRCDVYFDFADRRRLRRPAPERPPVSAAIPSPLHPISWRSSRMITLTRRQARGLRAVFRRSVLGIAHRGPVAPLVFAAEGGQLRARHRYAHLAVEHASPARLALERLGRPAARRPGRLRGPRRLDRRPRGRRPRPDRRPLGRPGHPPGPRVRGPDDRRRSPRFPTCPRAWSEVPAGLLDALAEATATRPTTTRRYALGCLQLQAGRDGHEVVATDGRQLLVRGGFAFPWAGDVLVRRSPLFACRDLPRDRPWAIGRTDTHVVLRVAPLDDLAGDPDRGPLPRRRPDPPRRPTPRPTRLRLDPADAPFLADALGRLPGGDATTRR